ncbi:MAG: hypothetical protein BA863_12315 [Desulfovibrio sp. S3730MH75]|nr:MAG: hypothetical protein BA863_12315 [Desulfovibrio sp. S3730MH75]
MGTWVPAKWTESKKVNPGGPGALVYDRFDLSSQYAESSFGIATDFIAQLEALLASFVVPESTISDVDVPALNPLSYEDRPALGDLTLPDIPANTVTKPKWTSVPSFDPLEFPSFNIPPPAGDDPIKPDHDIITDPGGSPTPDTIEYPAKPDVTFPGAPIFEDITFPSVPVITIPEFDGEIPTETWDMPPNFNYSESNYSSDIWTDLLSKVLNDIRNGGTGLGALIEEELYDRALRRQETENERLYREVESYFEARGFSLPVGAMAGRLAEAAREISRNNITTNAEIAINQADLAQKNTHFMVTKGIELEGMLRDFFNQQATRAFEAARTIATVGIEIFNAQINKFNARIQAYQAEGAVFESRVRGALTQAEIYRTQINACAVMSDVQKNLTAIYSEKINALNTVIKLYATEMEAAKIKSDVEKNKIEIFGLQVQVYVARIEADKAKFDVYVRELEAERTKALIYSEQVKAYLGEVEAVKVESDIQMQTSDLALNENQILADRYRAELSGYEVAVRATSTKIASLVEGFKSEAIAYSAETEAEGSWFRAKVEEMRVGVENAKTKLAKAVGEIDAAVKGFVAVKGLQVEGASGVMNASAQLCASTMNAVNATASVGYSGTESSGETWSHGESIGETHPYEEQSA